MIAKLQRTLAEGIAAVEAVGGKYAIVGGLAVGAWATPRATRDVDLYIDLDADGRRALQSELEARGFTVPAMEAEIERFGVFRARSPEGVFLDVFDATGPLGARDAEDLVALIASGAVALDDLQGWARRLDASLGSTGVSERVESAERAARRLARR